MEKSQKGYTWFFWMSSFAGFFFEVSTRVSNPVSKYCPQSPHSCALVAYSKWLTFVWKVIELPLHHRQDNGSETWRKRPREDGVCRFGFARQWMSTWWVTSVLVIKLHRYLKTQRWDSVLLLGCDSRLPFLRTTVRRPLGKIKNDVNDYSEVSRFFASSAK